MEHARVHRKNQSSPRARSQSAELIETAKWRAGVVPVSQLQVLGLDFDPADDVTFAIVLQSLELHAGGGPSAQDPREEKRSASRNPAHELESIL